MSTARFESFVTCVGSDGEALSALIWSRSLRRCWSGRKRSVVVAEDGVSPVLRWALAEEMDLVFSVPPPFTKEYGRSVLVYAVWSLKLWTKCIWTSAESLFLQNCDHLFDLKPMSLVVRGNEEGLPACPLFVFEPNGAVFHELMSGHKRSVAAAGGLDELDHFDSPCYGTNPSDGMRVGSWSALAWKELTATQAGLTNTFGNPKVMRGTNLRECAEWRHILFDDVLPWLRKLTAAAGVDYNGLNLKDSLEKVLDGMDWHAGSSLPKELSLPSHGHGQESQLEWMEWMDGAVAIIGMSCRFPEANDPSEFWSLLSEGRDAIRPFPTERLSGREKARSGSMCPSFEAGFLKCRVDEFDARFFGLSPREATFVDPQQRLLLEVSWEALENAGLNPLSLKGSRTGAYLGIHMQDYQGIVKPVTAQEYHHSYLGNAISATGSRLSYFLGLVGPNVAIEAGCSSSMVALHVAAQALKNGETNLALASGVNLVLKLNSKSGSTLMAVLSPDSRSKTFDAGANGFARAEGCGTVVLKRIRDALRDRDNILALVRGSAVVNDGPGPSFGTPSSDSQERVIQEALKSARCPPSAVSYVEAHGTGTSVGDPLEFEALARVYGQDEERKEPLLLGSVKTNIGHTESAAGIAGTMKVILSMEHGALPPHLHLQNVNPMIDLSRIPAVIPTKLTSWTPSSSSSVSTQSSSSSFEGARIAGVSSFSMSGTSTHVILQEWPPRKKGECSPEPHQMSRRRPQLITLSAKSPASLEALVGKYVAFLNQHPNTGLADLAYTLNVARAQFNYRLALKSSSVEELKGQLERKEYNVEQVKGGAKKICFLFTGQGSQYVGMGKALYENGAAPAFRGALDRAGVLYKDHLGTSLVDALWGPYSASLLGSTLHCQPALFCIEYALTAHWTSLGIRPSFVLGHSVGEFAAAVAVGLHTLEDALKLVVERSRLVSRLPSGRMLVLKTGEAETLRLIHKLERSNSNSTNADGLEDGLDIAAVNSPIETVVSGSPASVAALEKLCETKKVRVHKLSACHAFHSRAMEPAMKAFEGLCRNVQFGQINNSVAYYSGTYAKQMQTEDFCAIKKGDYSSYWAAHLRHTVKFGAAVRELILSGCNVFIEVGPAPVLLGLTLANLDNVGQNSGEELVFCPSLKSNAKESDWGFLLDSLHKLYVAGVGFDLGALNLGDDGPPSRIFGLPTYAFDRQRYWFVDEEDVDLEQEVVKMNGASPHPLLGHQMNTPFPESLFTSKLSLRRLPYLADHKVTCHVLLPAAGFIEAGLAVGRSILGGAGDQKMGMSRLVLRNIRVTAPLALPHGSTTLLQTIVKLKTDKADGVGYELSFKSPRRGGSGGWREHASALFIPGAAPLTSNHANKINLGVLKSKLIFKSREAVSGVYSSLFRRGLQFGSEFQSLECAWTNGEQLLAQLRLLPPSLIIGEEYVAHPIVLDAMVHASVFGPEFNNEKSSQEKGGGLRLPVGLDQFVWLGKPLSLTTAARPAAPITLYAYATNGAVGGNGSVSLHTEDGGCLAWMDGLQLAPVDARAFERGLMAERNPLPSFFGKEWVRMDTPPNVVEQMNENKAHIEGGDGVVLVFDSSSSTIGNNSLCTSLVTKMGASTIVLLINHVPGESGLKKMNDNVFTLDFRKAGQFEDLLQRLLEHVLSVFGATVKNLPHLDGILYTIGESMDMDREVCPAFLNLESSMSGLLSLVQQLVRSDMSQESKDPTKLMVVTQGAVLVGDEGVGGGRHPDGAPAWGLMRNFFAEVRHVPSKIVDVRNTGEMETTAEQLVAIYHRGGDDKLLALRNGVTYTEKLTRISAASPPPLSLPQLERWSVVVPSSGTVHDLSVQPINRAPLPSPDSNGGFVEVAVRASGLNFHDLMTILKPEGWTESVAIEQDGIGMDIAGVVTAVEKGVTRWKVGDGVCGAAPHGLQSHVVMHESILAPKPTVMTFPAAATLPSVFVTCYVSLVRLAHISKRDRILIHVATGGVGLMAIQIAKAVGAEIYATTGSHRKKVFLRQRCGIQHVYNSRTTEFGAAILKDTDGDGVTIVLNSLTGPGFKEASLGCCGKPPYKSTFIEIGKIGVWTEVEVATLRPDVAYHLVDVFPMVINAEKDPIFVECMGELGKALEDGAIRALARTIYPLDRVRSAFTTFQKAGHIGKIVIRTPRPNYDKDRNEFSLRQDRFDGESTYLITGGLGAIGLEMTKWMVGVGAKNIVLVGRHGPSSPETQLLLDQLRARRGAVIHTWQADLGNEEECGRVVNRIQSGECGLPPLRGILHASTVIADGGLGSQSWAQFETVFRSKLYPAFYLHHLSLDLDLDLDFFVMFSSSVSSVGSIGQANYSAANAYLDSLAAARHAVGLPSSSVNWGAWSDIGAASKLRSGQSGVYGTRALTPSQGIAAMAEFMDRHLLSASVLDVDDWAVLEASLNCKSLIADIMKAVQADGDGSGGSSGDGFEGGSQSMEVVAGLWKRVEELGPRKERLSLLEEYLKATVTVILKLRSSDVIEREADLSEVGIDSLGLMELRNHLQKGLESHGIVLTASVMQENRSVRQLAEQMERLLKKCDVECEGGKMNSRSVTDTAELLELLGEDWALPKDITIKKSALPPTSETRVVFLTGPTGFVGCHVAHQILTNTNWHLILLVRCYNQRFGQNNTKQSTREAGLARFTGALSKFGLTLDALPLALLKRVRIVIGDIVQPQFGLDQNEYDALALETDTIVHCAAKVHLLELYVRSSRPDSVRSVNSLGLLTVLRFGVARRVKRLFHPSYWAVVTELSEAGEKFPNVVDYISEAESHDFIPAYIVSKFVQEVLIHQALHRGLPCTVIRFPGLWGNVSSAPTHKHEVNHVGSLVRACFEARKFPMLRNDNNDPRGGIPMLTVDAAAETMVGLMRNAEAETGMYSAVNYLNCLSEEVVKELMDEVGLTIDYMPLGEWRDALFKNDEPNSPNTPTSLLPFKFFYENGREDGKTRLAELHPLFDERQSLPDFQLECTAKLRRNLGGSPPPTGLAAKQILKCYYGDILLQ